MKIMKKNGQKYPSNIYRVGGDYEIKTFSGNQRNRSPFEISSQNIKRSPNRIFEQGNSESALGEMIYLEPNETHYGMGQNMSPLNDSHNIIMRSPNEINRNEYSSGGVVNMYNRINFSRNPKYQQSSFEGNIEKSRSPKTINVGESPQDMEYNIKTFNRKKNNNLNMNINSPQNNYIGDRSYNMILNDTGNIFLDQPMQQAYNQPNDAFNSNAGIIQQGINEQRNFEQNNRDIQFGMNPRDFQEPLNGVLRKMSPKGNVEGESDTNSEKMDNPNQITDLKTQLEKNMNTMYKNEDGIGIGDKNMQNRGDLDNLEMMAKTRELQDNATGDEVKKLIKYYVKTYDPHKGEDGNLISNSQTIILSNHDPLFNDRYKVLQKMNKLSSILLAKKRIGSPDTATLNRSFGEDGKNKFDKSTFNNTTIVDGAKRANLNPRKKRFLYVSLAMLSAKGPNTEDRTIFRKMRLDKGGVVDLAQESLPKKSKFKIKKARAGGRGITTINPKYREKAAKIVQSWWRERKEKYKRILDQIIKIQSVWRGKFTRKYIYDVIYISYLQEKFLSIMRNVLVNHIRPLVFDELFSKNKLIKYILGELLMKYDKRFTLLRLKPYFLKWKNNSDLLSKRILKSKELFEKKEKNENKLAVLKKYFDKWVLMGNLYKYIGKAKNADSKRKKFFGTINLINGLSSLSKRQIFKNTKEPICNYLKDLLKQKILIKIIKKICKKCLELKIKNYLNDWRIATAKKKLDDFKKEVFLNLVNHMDSRLDKMKMKYYLDKWKNHLPKTKKIFQIKEGGDILQNFMKKNAFKYPLEAFVQKLDENNNREKMLKLLLIKKRYLKDKLRHYFDKWRNKKERLDDKDKRNELYKALLKNIINKINKRILYKRFNQWRTKPSIDVQNEMRKINNFKNKLHDIFKKHYYNNYKEFLDKLNKTRDEHTLKNAANKIFKISDNKRRIILRYYLLKWRSQTKNDELNDLYRQLLKYIIISMNTKNNRNKLGKYFTRWRLFVGDSKNYDNIEKLKLVLKGGDLLDNLFKRRLRDLIYRLYKKLGKDYRPKILGKLIKEIDKPHMTIRECFDRWKKIIDNDRTNSKISKFKAKIIKINVDGIKKRNNRDKLMRAFFHWRGMSKRSEEYYPKINNLLNSIFKYIKKKASSEPFGKIKIARNPTRYLLKLIKINKNQQKIILNEKLRNLLGRWRKAASNTNVKNLQTKIIYNIKKNLEDSQKKKILSKYLTKWKLNILKKGLDVNFVKGIDKLSQAFKAPFRKIIYDGFINKIKNVEKKKGANDLLKALDNHKKKILNKIILDWWKKAIKIDPNRATNIRTKIRKIIKYNEMEPRTKAFRKWVKYVQISKIKDKDLLFTKKKMGIILRHNDKMNLYNAFSRWRNKIHLLREQYLKVLLIKQIKTAQNAKEKMSNEAKLRRALLKWRTNILSINYLDTIKRIRKGCKLFKLGLKKIHERDILNNVKNLGKQNKRNFYLKNIIIKTIPRLYEQKIKNAIDIWKNKIGDTQKMKIKMKNLLDDYLYSDKVHQGLFKKPKEDILNLFKDFDNKRKDGQTKICKFVKGILKIPNYLRKMIIIKLLNSIVNKKDNSIKELKKIHLIRFYRQAQKLKADEGATAIQKFIKKKLRKLLDKKTLIKNGLEKFNTFIKRKCFDNIKNTSKQNYTTIILKKCIIKKKENNNSLLKDKLNDWRQKVSDLKELDSIIKIQNAYRKYNANKNLNALKLRKIILLKIHENNENKNKIKLMVQIRDWLHRALKTKNDEGAKTIQRMYRKILENKKKKIAIDKLKNLFKNNIKHKMAKIMEKVSKVLGGKGLAIYNTIQDILYRNPFNKLLNNLKVIGRINKLKKVQPKIHEKLKKYHLTKALQKWKEKTYIQTIKHTIILQKFLRDQYEKKKEKDKEKRKILLLEFVNKKIKNDSYKLELPFNIWCKKIKLEKINEAATKIQNIFRKNLANKKAKDLRALDKYLKLVNNLKKKVLLDIIRKIKENKENRNKRKKVLTKILSNKMFINNKTSLENCFNKWRKINQKMKNNASRIANAFRAYKSKKERDRLKKINLLMKKYILKHEKNDNDTLRSKLRKWNNKSNLLKINDKIIYIQKFFRPKLAKIRNDKIKKFFIGNAKKRVCALILLNSKINKLKNVFYKLYLNRFLINLKNIEKDKNKNAKLKKAINNTNNKTKNYFLKKYFDKWKNQHKKLVDKQNVSASLIQRIFNGHKARKEKNRLFQIKKNILHIFTKKNNTINNKLYTTLRKWIYIVHSLICNDKAKIIQKKWRQFQDKLKKDAELSRKLKIKNGLEKLLNIKFGGNYILDKLKSENNKYIFNKFNDTLKKKRLNNLKECFDKIKQHGFDNVLKKIIKIPDTLKKRIIKKAIYMLRDKSDKLSKIRSVDKIIKNWKIYSKNKKENNKKDMLKKILSHLILYNSNILKKVINKWNNISQKMLNNYVKKRIAKFMCDKYKIANVRNKWNDLVNKFKIKKRNDKIFNVIKRIKKYIILNKFKKPINNIWRKKLFDIIKNNKRKTIIYHKYTKLLPKINDKNNNEIIQKYLNKWKNNVDKLNKRENDLKNALNEITKRKKINEINNINSAMIIRKIKHDIPLARAKFFIQKIRENADKKNKFDRLAKSIFDSKNVLDYQKKEKFLMKLYKLYAYKKINGLLNSCKSYDNRLINIYGKDFINDLVRIKRKFTSYNYNNNYESSSQAKVINMKFKKKIEKNEKMLKDQNAPMRKVLPNFIQYIEKLIKRRKEDIYEKIKSELLNKNFNILLKKFNNRIIEPNKKEYIKKLKREAKYSETRPIYQIKLYQLFRKKYIRTIRTTLIRPSRLYKLFYLINMSKMHKNIAAQRYYREVIRKWRFVSFTKKMARKKLELMYKNLHASYLQMADEIFGEDKVNPSVFKEFERFGSDVGMFTGQEPEIDEELNKKYYSNVDKKYVFTRRASGFILDSEDLKKEEYIDDLKKGYEEKEGEIKHSMTQNAKTLKEQFDSIKKSGLSKKYFYKK